MAQTDLTAIRTKVRRLTRSPSPAHISDTDLDDYINTFVLYDFPEQLRLFSLTTTFEFFTEPNVDTYDENNTNFDPDKYLSVQPPVYVAGYKALYSQSRDQFYSLYPVTNFIEQIAVGDGATVVYSGTISNRPVLPSMVLFESIDAGNQSLTASDDGAGNLVGDVLPGGTIDYKTGVFSFSFSTPPGSGEMVNAQTRPYVPSRPEAVLFFDNQFILRPVPDKAYRVSIEAFIAPTELIAASQSPDLKQWWQYIAYGAAKKILEDRLDTETIVQINPEFEKQGRLVLRKTIAQITNQRTATIFAEDARPWYQGNFGGY